MIKKLLSFGLLALMFQSATAQNNLEAGAKMAGPLNRQLASATSAGSGPTVQTVNIQDTLWYFYNKYYYKTPVANRGFYTVKSPYQVGAAKVTHFGNTYLNTSTVTVSGLFGLVARGATSSPSVSVRILLCNATAAGVPILPAIDSVTSVLTGTAGIFAGGTLTTPKTVTGNFAVLYRNASLVTTDTILGFMASSTPTTGINFSDNLSYIRLNGAVGTTSVNFGQDFEFQTIPVVSFPGTAAANAASASSCAPATYTFTNMSSPLFSNRQFNMNKFLARWKPFAIAAPTGDSVFVWDPGDATGTVNNMPTTLTHTYVGVGSYTGSLTANYQLMADNGQKKMDIGTWPVTVSATGAINATTSGTTICTGQSATLTVSGAGTYTWTPAATLSSANGGSVVATPASTTVYTITGTSACGTASTTITQNVNSTIPTVSITASSASVCSGAAVSFTASGATTYAWMPGGSITATTTANPTTPTTYTVMGTTAGCTGTKTVAISITPTPTISVTSSTATICSGTSATLTASSNGLGYLWSNGNMTPVIVVSPTVSTVYTATTANTSSCTASANVAITVITCTTPGTGIDELSGTTISVYPNPNTGVLNIAIAAELANHATVQIFDALGQLVISQNLSSEQTMVNTSTLTNGVYIFKVMSGDKSLKIGRMIRQ